MISAAQATPEAHLHCLQGFSVRRTAGENQLSQHRRRTMCLACVLLGQKSPAIGDPVIALVTNVTKRGVWANLGTDQKALLRLRKDCEVMRGQRLSMVVKDR